MSITIYLLTYKQINGNAHLIIMYIQCIFCKLNKALIFTQLLGNLLDLHIDKNNKIIFYFKVHSEM